MKEMIAEVGLHGKQWLLDIRVCCWTVCRAESLARNLLNSASFMLTG